ncbi:MAG: hypothetical protein ACON4V_06725 [Parvibaculales bacterium]
MKFVFYFNFVIAFVFLVGETARRGIGYFAVNATTMLEDYVGGIVLLLAAAAWARQVKGASIIMATAWAYVAGGMFVPFFAHLEAWLRAETFRADHLHTDGNAVILKAVVWSICFTCFLVSLRRAHWEVLVIADAKR